MSTFWKPSDANSTIRARTTEACDPVLDTARSSRTARSSPDNQTTNGDRRDTTTSPTTRERRPPSYTAVLIGSTKREREERARLREEDKVRREIEREREKLTKELEHRRRVLESLRVSSAGADEIARAEAELSAVQGSIEGLNERAANTRAGYVYVIFPSSSATTPSASKARSTPRSPNAGLSRGARPIPSAWRAEWLGATVPFVRRRRRK